MRDFDRTGERSRGLTGGCIRNTAHHPTTVAMLHLTSRDRVQVLS